jgi:hypothetical protein
MGFPLEFLDNGDGQSRPIGNKSQKKIQVTRRFHRWAGYGETPSGANAASTERRPGGGSTHRKSPPTRRQMACAWPGGTRRLL